MRVTVMPADPWACGHYRMAWPSDVLKAQGHDITVVTPTEKTGFRVRVGMRVDGTQELLDMEMPEADVVVIQRPAKDMMVQMIKRMREVGIAVVVEIDDDLTNLHPDNIAYYTYRPGNPGGLSWRHTVEACKAATYVTTSTSRLQRVFAPHGRGCVLDNYVPEIYLTFEHQDTGFFGWAGTTKSHPDDLQVTGHAVSILMNQGLQFQVLGGSYGLDSALRLQRPVPTMPAVPLQAWASTMTQCFDVSMCPLSNSAFNASKSRLKAIEAMAVGLAWVASPREEYRRLHRESGVGLLADTPKRWVRAIKELMTNDSLRHEQVEAGREYMKTQTYQANAWRWLEAWETALKIQRGGA